MTVTNRGRKREDPGNEVDSPVDIRWMNQINVVKNIIRKMKQGQYDVEFFLKIIYISREKSNLSP